MAIVTKRQSETMSGRAKKDDDAIDVEEENSFEFSQETEISVTKPGALEKRDRRRNEDSSRAVVSDDAEYFDIE